MVLWCVWLWFICKIITLLVMASTRTTSPRSAHADIAPSLSVCDLSCHWPFVFVSPLPSMSPELFLNTSIYRDYFLCFQQDFQSVNSFLIFSISNHQIEWHAYQSHQSAFVPLPIPVCCLFCSTVPPWRVTMFQD